MQTVPLEDNSDNAAAQQEPVEDAFRGWQSKFLNLDWIAWTDDSHISIDERPTEWDINQANPTSVRHQYQLQQAAWQQAGLPIGLKSVEQLLAEHAEVTKAESNKFWAKRRIYEDAGWPDSFDREKFRRQRDRWNQRYRELADLYRRGPNAARWWQYGHGQALRDMSKETAGRHAV